MRRAALDSCSLSQARTLARKRSAAAESPAVVPASAAAAACVAARSCSAAACGESTRSCGASIAASSSSAAPGLELQRRLASCPVSSAGCTRLESRRTGAPSPWRALRAALSRSGAACTTHKAGRSERVKRGLEGRGSVVPTPTRVWPRGTREQVRTRWRCGGRAPNARVQLGEQVGDDIHVCCSTSVSTARETGRENKFERIVCAGVLA
jgi:hypothetical protein